MAAKALPSQEVLRQLLDYNPETGALTWRRRGVEWFQSPRGTPERAAASWNSKNAGKLALNRMNPNGYLVGAIFEKQYRAHRVIWAWMTGQDPFLIIDHVNGVRHDNAWSNLRLATKAENGWNSSTPVTNKSGFKGASWDKLRGRWRAQIKCEGHTQYLGLFDTPEDAHAAYAAAAIEMHREFAKLA